MFDLGVEVLAGEHEWIGNCFFEFGVEELAPGVVGVTVCNIAGGVDDLADGAEAVLEVEVFGGIDVAGVLGQYLAVSVDVHFFDIVTVIRV